MAPRLDEKGVSRQQPLAAKAHLTGKCMRPARLTCLARLASLPSEDTSEAPL
jgi:hypothetical protein